MADPQTANIGLFQPVRGTDVGTWDTPVNGNTGVLDTIIGGVTTISLNNSNVTLAAGQFQSGMIVFNSTLTGSVNITFPTTYMMAYEIQNLCSGTSANTITLMTTAAGGQVIACPPGEIFEVRNDGANIKFKNFGRIGSYWDYSGSSVPNWVSGCTVPPYLYCDGTTFSSAVYPALFRIMGGNTLPDSRGSGRFSLNDGTARITAAISFDGDTLFTRGGDEAAQTHRHVNTLNDPGHVHSLTAARQISAGTAGGGNSLANNATFNTAIAVTGITITNALPDRAAAQGNSGNLPPAYIGGITMVRAA